MPINAVLTEWAHWASSEPSLIPKPFNCGELVIGANVSEPHIVGEFFLYVYICRTYVMPKITSCSCFASCVSLTRTHHVPLHNCNVDLESETVWLRNGTVYLNKDIARGGGGGDHVPIRLLQRMGTQCLAGDTQLAAHVWPVIPRSGISREREDLSRSTFRVWAWVQGYCTRSRSPHNVMHSPSILVRVRWCTQNPAWSPEIVPYINLSLP